MLELLVIDAPPMCEEVISGNLPDMEVQVTALFALHRSFDCF